MPPSDAFFCVLANPAVKLTTQGLLRISALVFGVSVVVCLPFLLVGESFFMPLLETLKQNPGWLATGTVVLLGLDAVLPVPSVWVLMFLAQQAGVALGIIGGTVGLSLGVVVSAWVGRIAVGRVAPKFIPVAEIARLRESMERHSTLTLACMRSMPVLAETSVMIAAGAGLSLGRIFLATFLPNLVIAVVYSLAVNDSLLTAGLAFAGTIIVSYAFWRGFDLWSARRRERA